MALRVLITGASGRMGNNVRPMLRELGWQLRLIDLRPPDEPPGEGEEFRQFSIHDREALADACEGVDFVIHLAAHRGERPWMELLSENIHGTQAVLEVVQQAGIKRILFASSMHAVGFELFGGTPLPPTIPPRPDTYYGVSKVAGEALASLYADQYGMTVVSARIMHQTTQVVVAEGARARVLWFSPDDTVRLFAAVAALDSPGHRVVWGVSRGGGRLLDLGPGRAIGFDPVDDATIEGDDEALLAEPIGADWLDRPLGEPW